MVTIYIKESVNRVLATNDKQYNSRAYGGGVSGVSGNPFDSKTISKITCLNKYTIINMLASYAYLSANTI